MEGGEGPVYQLRRIGSPATCKGVKDVFRIGSPITRIGRQLDEVDFYLNSSVNKRLISRNHAQIERFHDGKQTRFMLIDTSLNGTFLNDVKVSGKAELRVGDTVTFGHTNGINVKDGALAWQPNSEFRFIFECVYPRSWRLANFLNQTKQARNSGQTLNGVPESSGQLPSPDGRLAASPNSQGDRPELPRKSEADSTGRVIDSPKPRQSEESASDGSPTSRNNKIQKNPSGEGTTGSNRSPSRPGDKTTNTGTGLKTSPAKKARQSNSGSSCKDPFAFESDAEKVFRFTENSDADVKSEAKVKKEESREDEDNEDNAEQSDFDDEDDRKPTPPPPRTPTIKPASRATAASGEKSSDTPVTASRTAHSKTAPLSSLSSSGTAVNKQGLKTYSRSPAGAGGSSSESRKNTDTYSSSRQQPGTGRGGTGTSSATVARSRSDSNSSDESESGESASSSSSSSSDSETEVVKPPAPTRRAVSKTKGSATTATAKRKAPPVKGNRSQSQPANKRRSVITHVTATRTAASRKVTNNNSRASNSRNSNKGKKGGRGGMAGKSTPAPPPVAHTSTSQTRGGKRGVAATPTPVATEATTNNSAGKGRGRDKPKDKDPEYPEVTIDTYEQCASFDCLRPLDATIDWVQCDDCDAWYHVSCVGCNYDIVREVTASFHCGCA